MKKLLFLLIFITALQFTFGQVDTKYYPKGDAFNQVEYIKSNPEAKITKQFAPFDIQKLIDEDNLTEGLDVLFRFGKGFDTKITLDDGVWMNVDNGQLWSMGFQSEGAFSINFIFDGFFLS